MKNYEYPFTHHIVFSLVMRDEEICRGVLQAIVPEGNQLLEKIDHSVETWNTGEGRRAIMTLELIAASLNIPIDEI